MISADPIGSSAGKSGSSRAENVVFASTASGYGFSGRHGRAEAGRVLLGRAHRHVEHSRRLRDPNRPGHHDIAVKHRRHQPLLQVNQEHHGTFGGKQHTEKVPAPTSPPTGRRDRDIG